MATRIGPRAEISSRFRAEDKRPSLTRSPRPLASGLAPTVVPLSTPRSGSVGRGSSLRVIGDLGGQPLALDPASGRFCVGGKLAGPAPGRGADAVAIYRAAELAAEEALFPRSKLSGELRRKIFEQLGEALSFAQKPPRTGEKEKTLSGGLALLLDLAGSDPASDEKLSREIVGRVVETLSREPDLELAAFYLRSGRKLIRKHADKSELRGLLERILPSRPPVEEWTQNRTQPLEVRHTIHPEFWKEELAAFSAKKGWKLLSKNAKDTRRSYEATLEDPAGQKAPLQVRMVVEQGKTSFFDAMSDPKVHVVLYSGHSALGANGSQAIQAAAKGKGVSPKLVLTANCRGKDNYAEFTNRWPGAHAIATVQPTYSDSGQARIDALFDMLAGGKSYRDMRAATDEAWWDEPADNYFYPDEWRRFGFTDFDEDGTLDGGLGGDRLFDVDKARSSRSFVRAINFVNSELFYHWELDHENGKKSYYGKEFGDSLVPSGTLQDPKKNELARVTPTKDSQGRTHFRVEYAPGVAARFDQNLYAALATVQVVSALAKHKNAELTPFEALRGVVMGADAVHYLAGYAGVGKPTYAAYAEALGLPKDMDASFFEEFLGGFDAHGSTEETKAFREELESRGVDLATWFEAIRKKFPLG